MSNGMRTDIRFTQGVCFGAWVFRQEESSRPRGVMHCNSPLLGLIATALSLAGCTHGIERGGLGSCTAESACKLEGRLHLIPGEPAGAAFVSSGTHCFKLALPDAFYSDPLHKQWNEQMVTVEGAAFSQPSAETEMGVLSWYAERDRKLATGICDHGLGIYVEHLHSESGNTWPKH